MSKDLFDNAWDKTSKQSIVSRATSVNENVLNIIRKKQILWTGSLKFLWAVIAINNDDTKNALNKKKYFETDIKDEIFAMILRKKAQAKWYPEVIFKPSKEDIWLFAIL